MNVRLYLWQRLTAAAMVPLIAVHLAVIFYATRQDLTAADILARTRGSIAWALFYGVFVAAAAVHAGIGLRNILVEWSPLRSRNAGVVGIVFAALLTALGIRSIAAVVVP